MMDVGLQKKFEGFRAAPYLCPAGVATIGYGSTRYENGVRVTMQDPPISKDRAEAMLKLVVMRFQLRIRAKLKRPLTSGEQAALNDFAYNLGCGALFGSTLLRKHMRGDKRGAAMEFRRWVYAGGRKLKGLIRRRAAERRLYRRRSYDDGC